MTGGRPKKESSGRVWGPSAQKCARFFWEEKTFPRENRASVELEQERGKCRGRKYSFTTNSLFETFCLDHDSDQHKKIGGNIM